MTLRGVEEVFEALQHLKNTKTHRMTEVTDFNRAEFLEEFVDSFNYFLSVLIITGFTPQDLFDAYVEKDKKIHDRLENGY
jgi:dimeric dUTPase (all-alpha-NTP-PPase superfamily)